MQRVTLLCVGRLREKFYIEAAAEYAKRLSRFCDLRLQEIPEERLPENPSPAQINGALAREAAALRNRIPPAAFSVALCVEGKLVSSETLAACLAGEWGMHPLVFLLGGSFGLYESLKTGARARLSMSPMTFPHHLARVMLLEQLYRGFQICAGGRYHK